MNFCILGGYRSLNGIETALFYSLWALEVHTILPGLEAIRAQSGGVYKFHLTSNLSNTFLYETFFSICSSPFKLIN